MKILFFKGFLLALTAHSAVAQIKIAQVVQEIENADSRREQLVSGVPETVTIATFKAICGPVGKQLKEVAKKNGWQQKQAAVKNRNPAHAADQRESKVIAQLEKDDSLQSLTYREGTTTHYFRRITVQKKCLACHGAKKTRPQFILEKFPADRAFGFKEGDLRGVYHVWFKGS